MDLKMRPMSDAPLKERVLVIRASGEHATISLPNDRLRVDWAQAPGVLGFYTFSDLLRAAAIPAAITPEGYEYASHEHGGGTDTDQIRYVHVRFRRIAPPVEYEYIAEAEPRIARSGDWVREGWQWKLVKADEHPYGGPQLCYRRVEVKR